jgi:HSP90 family molecular chaperone
MPPVGFQPTIAAGERPQIYALDRAATGTGIFISLKQNKTMVYLCEKYSYRKDVVVSNKYSDFVSLRIKMKVIYLTVFPD